MKIVSEPHPPEGWSIANACDQCRRVLEIGPEDVQRGGFRVSGFFFNDTAVVEQKWYFDCPKCGYPTFLDEGSLPEELRLWIEFVKGKS